MKPTKTIISIAAMLLFLFVTFPLLATEVKFLEAEYGKLQEQMGRTIKEAGWLRWNRGIIQAETGRFIQEGAQTGSMSQEALGSGIAASAHLDWELMGKQEQLGALISLSVLINQEVSMALRSEAEAKQVSMGQEIQKQARIDWIMGMMTQAAYASLAGDTTQEISGSMIAMLRSSRAFEHERTFRLAMTLLENETGRPMTQIFEDSGTGGSALTAQFTRGGLGGFAEYGLFSILGFLYVGWVFSTFLTHLGYPHEAKEAPYKLPEAA